MLIEIKQALLQNPDIIRHMLEEYGFAHITYRGKEFRCARNNVGNPTSICIKLNDNLMCIDYVSSDTKDLFQMIADIKGVRNGDVIKRAKELTGVVETHPKNILSRDNTNILRQDIVRDIAELDRFPKIFSKAFLDDNISLSAQVFFDIRYDFDTDRIIIPVYDEDGNLVGAKGRANYPIFDAEPKYLYLLQCIPSNTLYGLSHNKSHISNQLIIICESEKSVMQAYTYGNRSCVGIGSNHLSEKQCALIAGVMPKTIVLALDKGLDKRNVHANVKNLLPIIERQGSELYVWEPSEDIPDKASPTDMGAEMLDTILREQLVKVR